MTSPAAPSAGPAGRTPVAPDLVDALDDLAEAAGFLLVHFSDPIDRACLEAAEHLISQLADAHRPPASAPAADDPR